MKKNYPRIFFLILTITVLVLASCKTVNEVAPTQEPTTEQPLPTTTIVEDNLPVIISPAADKTAVSGRIVHPDGSSRNNLNVRLAEV